MTGPAPTTRRISRAWLLLLPLACIELVGSWVVRARVPDASDWDDAATAIAADWQDGDAITVAPRWADPLLREAMGHALGERFDLAIAGSPGLEGDGRLWALSIRGHDSALIPEGSTPEFEHTYGRVRVERHRLDGVSQGERVLFDFVDSLELANASRSGRPCNRSTARPSGGGLGAGPVVAAQRFTCAGENVGETVIEDLQFEARRCIWQRPMTGAPVTLRFESVPLGERLVLHAGLHWVEERHHIEADYEDAPVTLSVWASEAQRSLGDFTHHDGDGWATYSAEIPAELRGTTQTLIFTVRSGRTFDRSFCWSGRSLTSSAEHP